MKQSNALLFLIFIAIAFLAVLVYQTPNRIKSPDAEVQKLKKEIEANRLKEVRMKEIVDSAIYERDIIILELLDVVQGEQRLTKNLTKIVQEYEKVKYLHLDSAGIMRFYLDSCAVYTPY